MPEVCSCCFAQYTTGGVFLRPKNLEVANPQGHSFHCMSMACTVILELWTAARFLYDDGFGYVAHAYGTNYDRACNVMQSNLYIIQHTLTIFVCLF